MNLLTCLAELSTADQPIKVKESRPLRDTLLSCVEGTGEGRFSRSARKPETLGRFTEQEGRRDVKREAEEERLKIYNARVR